MQLCTPQRTAKPLPGGSTGECSDSGNCLAVLSYIGKPDSDGPLAAG